MERLYNILDELEIEYTVHEHPAVFTCEEADTHCAHLEGGKSKNLFLRNKKGSQHFLVVAESSREINLKELGEAIGAKNLSFASEERLQKFLGLTPGSVTPFGLINDPEKNVRVVIDSGLLRHDKLLFHPNINTATVELSTEGFRKFLGWSGHRVREF